MKLKINISRSLRTCTIAIILFALLFSTILTIPSFNVLAQNQSAAPLNETETETEAEIETGNETDVEDETTPEAEPEEIISANFDNASLITDKSTYSPGEPVNISLLYVPSTATVNLAIISPSPGGIVYIALAQETGVYSFTETTETGTYLISANLSFELARELENETETKTQTLTLTKEFEVAGEEGKVIGEGLKEKGEERGFDLNNVSLSVDKTTYALGETVRICLAAPPEVINNFSIINPAGIFYAILPSASGEYEFKPDSAGNYVINVSLQASADSGEKFLTAEFDVMDLGLEIVFEEPEQGEIVVGEPVNWTQHISITNHGNVSISNYALTIPLPDDYSNLSSDFYNHKITQISTRNCGDAGCKMQDAIINLSPITHHPSLITPTLILIALAPGENLSFNISYQTSPVELEVVEASIDISDLIPSDAFDIGIYKEIGTGEEELEDVSSLSLTESKVKVKQVTVLHNSSMHYHNIPVCIEAEANTKVVELVNGTEKEIESEISDKNASWIVPELSNRTFMITKKELLPEQAKAEIDKPVEWQLNFSGTIIKYKTTAPFKNETAPRIENGTWKKEITIGSNASVHYSNVTAFTNLSLEKKVLPKKQQLEEGDIKLFLINLSSGGKGGRRIDVTDNPAYNVSFVDTDDNGLIDRVQWNVPFLSNKTFEVEQRIEVINVQSHPTVGGNWTVMFNTTGTANLTITAVNGTTWSNVNEDNDLKFLEIKCGDNLLDYQWINNSVFIENYSCDETGYEISKVLTPGKHTLEFRFGTDVEYAHNLATESLWSESNSVSGDLTLTSSGNADGATTGTWADANGKWAKKGYWWEFMMTDSTQTGTINNVTLYLKHLQSGWANDNFLIQIYDGSSWIDVQSYTSGSGPPMSDTTNNWDVKALGIDTWTEINAAKVRIIGNGKTGGEDTVDWFVDTVELRIDYTLPSNQPPVVETPKTYDNETLDGKTDFKRTDTVTVRVNVTDADGASDISKVLIKILNTTDAVKVDNETMTNISSITDGYTYEYNYTIPSDADAGTWTINVYANDTANAWDSNTTTFDVATERLWSESNLVSGDLTLTSSGNADGSGTGTWADANGKWAKKGYWWEFVMADSTQTGTINGVTLYLKHRQSSWADDNFLIQIYDGSSWINVQSYIEGSGPPTSDTTDNWDVKTLGIDTWTEINAAKVRIIGNGKTGGEDTVDWFVDTVELRIDYTPADTPDLRVVNVTFDNWETGANKASVSETGTGYHVKEGRNITVNATIANYGNRNVTANFNVSFFDCAGVHGDWSTWFGNYTYNVTEKGQLGNASTGYPHNTTYAIVYWDLSLVGTHNISVWADPENTLGEASGNLTNNNGSALINVSAWQKYRGNVSGNIVLAGSAGDNMSTWDWPAGSIGNLYIVNHSATINWTALQALGYNKTDGATTNDFLDADINLGMNVGSNNATGFANNNITELFSTDGAGASARSTTSFTVYGKPISNVPIINSTDMTNHTDVANATFKTGILWDTSDDKDGDGEYDTTDKEALVFIANIRNEHDYKIAIPCALNAAIGGELDFYVELR